MDSNVGANLVFALCLPKRKGEHEVRPYRILTLSVHLKRITKYFETQTARDNLSRAVLSFNWQSSKAAADALRDIGRIEVAAILARTRFPNAEAAQRQTKQEPMRSRKRRFGRRQRPNRD